MASSTATPVGEFTRFEFEDGTYMTPGLFSATTTKTLKTRLRRAEAAGDAHPDFEVYRRVYRAALELRGEPS